MITLSYSTMNALINEPHTWLCKQMGLKTFTTHYFEAGKAAHRIVQDHVSGGTRNVHLVNVPDFSVVELKDFDERCKIKLGFNDKYEIIGFYDGFNPETGDLLEIKTGRAWSPTDFAKLMQWKIYALAKPEVKKVWLVNAPSDPNLWMEKTVKVFVTTVTPQDLKEAEAFIEKAINIIENIKTVFDTNLTLQERSKWCFYQDCPWCPAGGNQ